MFKNFIINLIFYTQTILASKNILNIYTFIVCISFFQFTEISSQDTQWSQAIGIVSSGDHSGMDLAISPDDGSVIYVGYFQGDLSNDWGDNLLPSKNFHSPYGAQDGYVAKYDKNGVYQWAFKIGGEGTDIVNSIFINKDGTFFIAGTVGASNSTDFAGTSVTVSSSLKTTGRDGMFIAKYTKDGGLLWYYISKESSGDVNGKRVYASEDAVYVTGSFVDNLVYDDETIPEYDDHEDVFITKFDLDGSYQWTLTAGSHKADIPAGLLVDESAIYVTGTFRGYNMDYRNQAGETIASDANTDVDDTDIFLASWDLNGNFRWSETIGSDYDNFVGGITMFGDSLFLAGAIEEDAIFPGYSGGPVSADERKDMFISSHGKDNGSTGWVRRMTSSENNDEIANDINVDRHGNLYITGVFHNQLSVPGDTTFLHYEGDILVALSFDPTGGYLWGKVAGNTVFDTHSAGMAIAADDARRTYVTGKMDVTTSFDGEIIWDLTGGSSNIFLATILPECTTLNIDAGDGGVSCDLNFQLDASITTGVGFWSKKSGPGLASFLPDNTEPKAIVSVNSPGTYYFTWTEIDGACEEDSTITVVFRQKPSANAGEGATVCGNYTILNATPSIGTGTWTKTTGPGTATFSADNTDPGATVTVSEYGTYIFTWTESNGGCVDDSSITVIFLEQPDVNAGLGGEVCDPSAILNATPSVGTGSWTKSFGPGSATFVPNNADPNATVSVSMYGTYNFKWKESNGTCVDDSTIKISFTYPPVATPGDGGSSCNLNYKFNGSLTSGSGYWTKSSGPGTVSFVPDNTSPTATARVTKYGDYEFTWTETNGICSDDATIQVSFYEQPDADAGDDGAVCALSYTLHATLSSGTGVWSQGSGPGSATFFPNASDPHAVVTVGVYGSYQFIWTETNGTCSDMDVTLVDFYLQPESDPGSGGTSCDTLFNLNASLSSGVGIWSQSTGPGTAVFKPDNTSPNAQVSVTEYGSYTFTWTETNGICSDDSSITVNFYEQPVANAGAGGDACESVFALNARLSSGDGEWSKVLGPGEVSFSPNATDPNAVVSVSVYGSYQFRWTETNGSCTDQDDIIVNFYLQPTADPGSGGASCDLFFDLAATLSSGAGEWSKVSGPGTVSFVPNRTASNARVEVSEYGSYTFSWIETNGVCVDDSNIVVDFYEQPVANAGEGGEVCGLSYPLGAELSTGVGFWSIVAGPGTSEFVPDETSPTAELKVEKEGTYILRWTELNGTCSDMADIEIKLFDIPVADPGDGGEVCGALYQLQAVPSSGDGEWSQVDGPGTVFFAPSSSDAKAQVSITEYGLYHLKWSETNGPCRSDSVISILFTEQPIADPGGPIDVCGLHSELGANPSVGNGNWELVSGAGDIDFSGGEALANPSISASEFGEYKFRWSETNGGCMSDSTVVVKFLETIESNPGMVPEPCGFETTLSAILLGGTGTWTKVSGPGNVQFLPHGSAANAKMVVDVEGSYEINWAVSNGSCFHDSTITITFMKQAIAQIDVQDTVCGNYQELWHSETAGIGSWSQVSGAGNALFSNGATQNTTDLRVDEFGNYELKWDVRNGHCVDDTTVRIVFMEEPLGDAGEGGEVCGLTFNLKAEDGPGEGTWLLLEGPGSATFIPDAAAEDAAVEVSEYGKYTFKWRESNGKCEAESQVEVRFIEQLEAGILRDQELCGTETIISAPETSADGYWSDLNASDKLLFGDMYTPISSLKVETAGEYAFGWIVGEGICKDTARATILFKQTANLQVSESVTICEGEKVQLWASSDAPILWDEHPLIFDQTLNTVELRPLETTRFSVSSQASSGCIDTASIDVMVDQKPSADAGPDQELDYTFSGVLDAVTPHIGSGKWQVLSGNGQVLDEVNSKSSFSHLSIGANTFGWLVSNGVCPDALDSVTVVVNDLFIPNVITPNGDGKNDNFVIGGIESMGSNTLIIFNRWGNEIYRTSNYKSDWKGEDQDGNTLPADTYFYVLETKENGSLKGYITIRR